MSFSSSNITLARKGKTAWVNYAIRRRLSEKKPFIWYDSAGYCVLFVEEGVFSQKLQDIVISPFVPYMWTFVVDNYQSGIPPLLTRRDTSLFNIYTTSVPSNIWKRMRKTTYCAVAIMNPWTREEMAKA
jgi:hypothetical protein